MRFLGGKVVVITGAGSGMGKASVKILIREGAEVVAADVSGAERDTAAELGAGVLPVRCDVTREGHVEAMIAAAVDELGRVDVVLDVAGIADGCMLGDLTMELYDEIMDVDLRGVLLGMKHGIRAMQTSAAARSSTGRPSAGSTGRRARACTRRRRPASSPRSRRPRWSTALTASG